MNALRQHALIQSLITKIRLSWPLCFAALFFLVWLFHAAPTTLLDPDTYLHITIGQRIMALGVIPTTDPFSHTLAGAPWVAHEWLADIALSTLYEFFGWAGLHTLTIGICALTLAYVLRFLLDRQVPPAYAIFFTILTAASLLSHLLARPHIFTWPILALWFGALLKANETGQRPTWWLIPLLVLWANIHGSYVLGLAILPLLGLDALLSRPASERYALVKAWGIFIVMALLATLITPYGWHNLMFAYDLLTQPGLRKIDEWGPVNFSDFNALEIWIGVLLSLACLGLLKLSPIRLVILLALLHEALAHVRYMSIFGILVPLLIAVPFQQQYAHFIARLQPQESTLDKWFNYLTVPASRASSALVILLLLAASYFINTQVKPQPPEKYAPRAALAAARQAGLEKSAVFNDYSFGGYLIREGIPVFIDGRADMYGAAYLKAYFDAIDPNNLKQINAYLDAHQIEWTLLPANNYLVDYLSTQPAWKQIHSDEHSVVHQRVH